MERKTENKEEGRIQDTGNREESVIKEITILSCIKENKIHFQSNVRKGLAIISGWLLIEINHKIIKEVKVEVQNSQRIKANRGNQSQTV